MAPHAQYAQSDGPWFFDINLNVVRDTTQQWLPSLLNQLLAVYQDADNEDRNTLEMEP